MTSARELPKTGRVSAFSTLLALTSGGLLALAFPPMGCWPLAWVAPIGWCLIVSRPGAKSRWFYGMLYAVGVACNLAIFHWVRLPHWSAAFGWLALCSYLGAYLPLFVGLSRSLVHRWRWPLWLACPVAWCGLELARSYFMTGFSMGLLGHTLIDCPRLIQIASLGGAYLVSFLVMLVAAAIAEFIATGWGQGIGTVRSRPDGFRMLRPVVTAGLLLLAAWSYGNRRISSFQQSVKNANPSSPNARIALIQGCRDTTFDESNDPNDTLKEYRDLTAVALRNDAVDLVVWPESMHVRPWVEFSEPIYVPPEYAAQAEEFRANIRYMADMGKHEAAWFDRQFDTAALVGCAALEFGESLKRYNRALWVDRSGHVAGSYDKMHPVMFGEYVPLGNVFPWLYRLTPMGNGLTAGEKVEFVDVAGIRLCPSICYENTVPHLIRKQVRQLTAEGNSPHALVTISNDGWFWGSSELDLHLVCGAFRAVEMDRPALIAANTGFSAVIDRMGRVTQRGPRHAPGVLIAEIGATEPPSSVYLLAGDWWAFGCLGISLICGLQTCWYRKR